MPKPSEQFSVQDLLRRGNLSFFPIVLIVKYAYEHLPVIITASYPENFGGILAYKSKIHLEMEIVPKHFSL